METTRLSSKGQVILPKSIRASHKWEPGVEFAVEDTPDGVRVTVTFDPENAFPVEQQRAGWQAILDNFRRYAEGPAATDRHL